MKKDKMSFASSMTYRNGYEDGEHDGIEKSTAIMSLVMLVIVFITIIVIECIVQGRWERYEDGLYSSDGNYVCSSVYSD